MKENLITMSQKEINRLEIIQKLIAKRITESVAAEMMQLTVRQVRRIKKNVSLNGPQGLVHKSRGRSSNRKYPKEFTGRVLQLLSEKYTDFGPTLACEKLPENEDIRVSKEWL